MDPLNWSFRFYLIEAIDYVGFDQENPTESWEKILQKLKEFTNAFLGHDIQIDSNQCHLFYLQMLAEFGDFRSLSDPFTYPSEDIKEKIKRLRRAELRQQLLIVNNQIRFNNYVRKHHNHEPISQSDMRWLRFKEEPELPEEQQVSILPQIAVAAKSEKWYQTLPINGKGPLGLKDMSIDNIISRIMCGFVTTPMELLRDVLHLITNLCLDTHSLTEKEKESIQQMKEFFIEKLRPYLMNDPKYRDSKLIQEIAESQIEFYKTTKREK
ncbi:hypothetical protein GPJ56_007489 [Histomonas meleagridis]|uniref:uncharacterized protein n=1 Tax=Histomonas meleagridis TaxID=135588 RepID=UPI003559FDEB|nr:hypothetical protein GPJ56_007489 [Histomonas meleagridis]KAH0804335.1 hypothetical protein GO595_003165 [Histomonas meleagridis]